jgi:hypothetical protein
MTDNYQHLAKFASFAWLALLVFIPRSAKTPWYRLENLAATFATLVRGRTTQTDRDQKKTA